MDMQNLAGDRVRGPILEQSGGETAGGPAQERPSPDVAAALPQTLERATAPQEPRRVQKRRLLLALLAAGAIGGGLYYGYYYLTQGQYLVSTNDAYVRADLSVLSAKVPGYVTEVFVKDNDTVTAGATLAQIDPRDYQLAVEAAVNKLATQDATIERLKQQVLAQDAAIEQANAQVASAKANQVRMLAEFERAQTLERQEYGSKQRLDQARADRDQGEASVKGAAAALSSATATLAVLKAQVKEAEGVRAELKSSLDKAQLDLDFATIKAPFGGIVGNRAMQPGQYVQAGTRLFSLVPLSTAYVEANYKETQLENIRTGQPVTITVDAAGGKEIAGVVESIAPAAGSQYSLLPPENATGNFTKIVQRVPVRVRVAKDAILQGILRPGLSVVTYIDTKKGAPQKPDASAQTAAK